MDFVINSHPKRYAIVDGLGEKVEGTFYGKELLIVHPDENREYKLNEILKYRKNKKKKLWFRGTATAKSLILGFPHIK